MLCVSEFPWGASWGTQAFLTTGKGEGYYFPSLTTPARSLTVIASTPLRFFFFFFLKEGVGPVVGAEREDLKPTHAQLRAQAVRGFRSWPERKPRVGRLTSRATRRSALLSPLRKQGHRDSVKRNTWHGYITSMSRWRERKRETLVVWADLTFYGSPDLTVVWTTSQTKQKIEWI